MPDTSVIDMPDMGPALGPVTVLVVDATNQPSAGIDVYFNEPGGTVVKVTTGTDGKASHQQAAGGSIFVALQVIGSGPVMAPFSALDMTTVLDVQPNDVIHVSPPGAGFVAPNTVGTLTGSITVQPTVADAGNLVYTLDFGNCGAFQTQPPSPYSWTITADCLDAAKNITFLAVATDTNTNAVVAYQPVTVPLGADAGQTTADVTAWQLAGAQKTMTYTGTINGVDGGGLSNVDVELGFPKGALNFQRAFANNATQPPANPIAYTPPPAAFTPNVQTHADVFGYDNTILETYVLEHYSRVPQNSALVEDFGKLLPFMHDNKLTGPNTSPTLTWVQAAPIGSDAIGSVSLGGTHSLDGGQPYNVNWQIVYPAQSTTTSVTFPAMPAAVAAIGSPDTGWTVNQNELAVSAQAPYALAHLYPTIFLNPGAFQAQVPTGSFDLKTTNVYYGGAF
jgi:hypothetical protein